MAIFGFSKERMYQGTAKLTRIDEKMTRGCLLRICPSGKDPITWNMLTQMTFEMVSILSAKIDIFATY